MMWLLLFLLLGLVIFNAVASSVKPPAGIPRIIDVPKNCPPHKWKYHEIKDKEGNTVRWKLACDLCGPLKPIDGSARSE